MLVVGGTPGEQRRAAFAATAARRAALVQVSVVSEGVDLPGLRRLVDCRPTLSPVYWLQCLGRIRRPVPSGEPPPEYICTNRNLSRHCYLLEGMLPLAAVREAQGAFETPSRRMGIRVVGLVPGLIVPSREEMPPEAVAKTDATVPLGRAGLPADLAGPAVFLASDDAAYMTGSFVTVDGGVLFQQRSPQVETFALERFPTAP